MSPGLARPAAAALLVFSGCCSVPEAGRYFDRATPYDAVSGFAYAIETSQWRFAYDSLTERSKELITFSKFKLALRFGLKLPGQEMSVRDLIVSARRLRLPEDPPRFARQAVVPVRYETEDGTLHERNIFLEREPEEAARAADRDPIWRIDLDRTMKHLQAAEEGGVAGR